MSLITAGIGPLCAKTLGGVSKCFIAPREYANTYNIEGNPTPFIEDWDSLVASITDNGTPVDWYQWHVDERASEMSDEKEDGTINGTIFNHKVSLFIPGLSAHKRAIIRQLFTTPVVVVMQMRSGKAMLAGRTHGLLPKYEATTATINGAPGYKIELAGADEFPIREIDINFLTNVVPPGPIP